jgi:hypothetical protein
MGVRAHPVEMWRQRVPPVSFGIPCRVVHNGSNGNSVFA